MSQNCRNCGWYFTDADHSTCDYRTESLEKQPLWMVRASTNVRPDEGDDCACWKPITPLDNKS